MSDLLYLSEAAGTVLLGLGSVWFARKSAHQTRAIGNGFADHVLHCLDDITQRLERLEKKKK